MLMSENKVNMTRKIAAWLLITVVFTICFSPSEAFATDKRNGKRTSTSVSKPKSRSAVSYRQSVYATAYSIYDSMKLHTHGLSKKAFQFAWYGYQRMIRKGLLTNRSVLTICDFTQSSKNKRLYIIDVAEKKLVHQTYVAHGRNSGKEYAYSFSNRPESHKSSLGFYVTSKTYSGEHGLSLKLKGVERGINDRAMARRIVIHGSAYVGDEFIQENKYSGRSYGCPAIPFHLTEDIINIIKEGSCLFIYHPAKYYLAKSTVLNG
jgi:hypothetical protein